jgi:hypothetical protein
VSNPYGFYDRRLFCRSLDTHLRLHRMQSHFFNAYYSAGTSRFGFKLIRRIFSINLARSLGDFVSASRIFNAFIFLRRR